jgi:nickel-dependent lactate racemase
MSTRKVSIPFEEEVLEVDVPASWEILARLEPRDAPRLEDVARALIEALASPIGCEPLADLGGKRIVIVVDDVTRPTPLHLYFHHLLAHLEACGAERGRILVKPALGVHRPMTHGEMASKVGEANLDGIAWENPRLGDAGTLVDLGETSRGTRVLLDRDLAGADLIICCGAIEPHLLLGFGGGLKMLLPGMAHPRTVAENHMQGVTHETYNFVGVAESQMRLDLEEGALKLGKPVFIVNVVMNSRLEISRFVCGDPVEAHRAGVEMARSINARQVERQADVAIVASNPMNADLRQGMKCIGNVEQCVRDGGLIIAFAECRNGIGDVALPPKALPNGLLRFILRLIGRGRILWFIDKVKKGAGVEERFMAHFSMQVVRKARIMVFSRRLPSDTGKKLGLLVQYSSVDELMAAAARHAPRRAKVYVFPHGGVTFPVVN